MSKTEKKLYDFLEGYIEEHINNELRMLVLKNGHAMVNLSINHGVSLEADKISKEDYKKAKMLQLELDQINYIKIRLFGERKEFFCDFELLSKFLVLSPLNSRECLEIIVKFMNLNVNDVQKIKQEFPNVEYFDYVIYSFDKLHALTKDEKQKIEEYQEYLSISDVVLTKEEKVKKDYVIKKSQSLILSNPEEYIEQVFIFKDSYIDKKDSYEQSDITKIVDVFKFFKINDSLISRIKTLLFKELNKRNIIEVEIKPSKKITTGKKSLIITDKEYRAIKRELRTYFDFYNVEKVRELTYEEILHCIELLVKIDMPLIEIKRFISFCEVSKFEYAKNNLSLLDSNNPISLYVEMYNKLKFYEKKSCIEEELIYIKDCLESMFICDLEEYEFFKLEIEETLRKILVLLPQTYEYEIKETIKRIKLEK